MTLRSNREDIESAQAHIVEGAGGHSLQGSFAWTPDGWELTLKELTFFDLLRIVETVKEVVRRCG